MSQVYVVVSDNNQPGHSGKIDPGGPIILETYIKQSDIEVARDRAAKFARMGRTRIARLIFDDEEAGTISANLCQQAQIHAQEARTQKATVLEIYQLLGIQKGDWNGAQPVREKFSELYDLLTETLLHLDPKFSAAAAALIERIEKETGR